MFLWWPRSSSRSALQAIIRFGSWSWGLLSSPASRCRCTIRLPSFLRHLCLVIWCSALIVFALRLVLAEHHYARGWHNGPYEQEMAELRIAANLFPFERKFRNGPLIRFLINIQDNMARK